MRLFRRARDTKTSVIRREAVSATAEAKPVLDVHSLAETGASSPIAPVVIDPTSERLIVPAAPVSYEALEDSDVFLCSQQRDSASLEVSREVTLFVHGWHNVEPGLLSWTFPSLRAALDAVKRMRNAIGWCVVSGTGWNNLDAARAGGAVLVEQLT